MPDEGEKPAEQPRQDPPEYNVYRSRPSLRERFGKPGLEGLRNRLGRGGDDGDKPPQKLTAADGPERPLWKRIAKWAGIAALGWIVLSMLAFAVSAQIQKGKL